MDVRGQRGRTSRGGEEGGKTGARRQGEFISARAFRVPYDKWKALQADSRGQSQVGTREKGLEQEDGGGADRMGGKEKAI